MLKYSCRSHKQRRVINKTVLRVKLWTSLVVLLGLFSIVALVPKIVSATADPNLTGGSAVTGHSGSATPISDLQVTGTGNPTVPVKLFVSNGSLAMTTVTGLTFSGSSTGATLQFSGTLANVNADLATLQYTRTGTGTDSLEVSLVNAGEVFFPDNGHLYEYVSYTASWQNATTNVAGRTKYGATGYLATVTSQAENDFVSARLLNSGWMGASDSTVEGDWKWVTGPESGISFWSGTGSGSAVSGRYSNWNSGEPNDSGGNEDCAQFLTGGTGKWNDLPCSGTTQPGYVAEYGSDASPLDIASKTVAITTLAANQTPSTPTALGPTTAIDGSWSNAATPSLSLSLSDPDTSDTVAYQVQVDDTSNFSSPVVDYTSALAAQGARSFTVGQAAGGGSYTVGSSSQTLSSGSYYWRVKTVDNSAAASAYTTANSGSIAFKVDATNPSTPGTSTTTTTPTSSAVPTWTWTASTDGGSGLAATPYTVQWSQSSTFSSGVSAGTSTTASYTQPTPLADGVWYFRVIASDTVGNNSSFSPSGSVLIDTVAPTVPGTPSASTAANNSAPQWSWTASTDSGSGLASPAYTVEWSQSSSFASGVSSAASTAASFTQPTALADGLWYFRVKATDAVDNQSSYSLAGSITINTAVASSAAAASKTLPTVIKDTGLAHITADEPVVAPTTTGASGSSILLNDFDAYSVGTGKQLNLGSQQSVHFIVQDLTHNAVVSEVGSDYAVLVLHSDPMTVRLNVGQTALYDVDKNGSKDISITLLGTTNDLAQLVFSEVKVPATTVAAKKSLLHASYWLWIIVLVILIVIIVLLRRRRQHSTDKSSAY